MIYGFFGPIVDRPPLGKVGDLARPWKDYSRQSEYGEITEVRPAKNQDPTFCYLLYVYRIRFKDGTSRIYKAGECEIKKKGNDEQGKET